MGLCVGKCTVTRWRILDNEELPDLYLSPNIIINDQIKEDMKGGVFDSCGEERRDYYEDLNVDGRILEK
jgi:hypothetical protein